MKAKKLTPEELARYEALLSEVRREVEGTLCVYGEAPPILSGFALHRIWLAAKEKGVIL